MIMKKYLKDGKCWCEHTLNFMHMNAMKISTNLKSTYKKFNNHIKKHIALEMKHSRKFTNKDLMISTITYCCLPPLRSGLLPPNLWLHRLTVPECRNPFPANSSTLCDISTHLQILYLTVVSHSLFVLLATRLQNYTILLTNVLKARNVQKLHIKILY